MSISVSSGSDYGADSSLDPKDFHTCNQCGKRFNSASNLSRHERVHSGDKPYRCEICNKCFNQKGNLTKHLKSHENAHLRWNRNTKDKPFKCPHPNCDKSFTVKINLENHLLSTHHGMSISESIPTVSIDNHNPELVPAYPGEGFGNVILAVRATEVPCPVLTKMVSRCLHVGCNHTFDSAFQLRAHLFQHAPGLEQEMKAMREHMMNLISILQTWDVRSGADQRKMHAYVDCIKKVILDSLQTVTDGSFSPSTKSQTKLLQNNDDNKGECAGYKEYIPPDTSNAQIYTLTRLRDDLLQSSCQNTSTTDLSTSSYNSMGSQYNSYSSNNNSIIYVSDRVIPSVAGNKSSNLDNRGYDSEDENQLIDTILDENFLSGVDNMDIDACTVCDIPSNTSTQSKSEISVEAIQVTKKLDSKKFEKAPIIAPTKEILNGWMQHLIRIPTPQTSSTKTDLTSSNEEDKLDEDNINDDDSSQQPPEKKSKKILSIKVLKKAFGFK